ncbi:hypothetical protein QM012_000157 [Aureobasidium pullulans]|uniref:Uncharacterized protein n=1 Tax=Aureobasidium pullulans TaxID=5580 RepID=A0ABR0TUU2_AURPU
MERPPPGFMHSNNILETALYRFRCPEDVYSTMTPRDKEQLVPLAYRLLEKEHDALGLQNFCELRKQFGDASVAETEMHNILCFHFMQHYPWFMRKLNKGVRLFVGHLECHLTRCELWVGWHPSTNADAPPELKFYGECGDDIEDHPLKITPELRKYIQWHDSFETGFRIKHMSNGVVQEELNATMPAF